MEEIKVAREPPHQTGGENGHERSSESHACLGDVGLSLEGFVVGE